jgi:hypothetical protein
MRKADKSARCSIKRRFAGSPTPTPSNYEKKKKLDIADTMSSESSLSDDEPSLKAKNSQTLDPDPQHPSELPPSCAGLYSGYNRPLALPSTRAGGALPSHSEDCPAANGHDPSYPAAQRQPPTSSPSLGGPISSPSVQTLQNAGSASQNSSDRPHASPPAIRCTHTIGQKGAGVISGSQSSVPNDLDAYLVQDNAQEVANEEAKKQARPVSILHTYLPRDCD